MATNYVQEGKVMTFTAPSGGVVSGTAYKIGQLLVVAQNTVAQGLPFQGRVDGVHTLPKLSAQAWTEGAVLYWDNTNKHFTTVTAAGHLLCASAAEVAANPSATGKVRLNGVAVLNS